MTADHSQSEINSLVVALRRKLREQDPKKTDQKIEQEIRDRMGGDYEELLRRSNRVARRSQRKGLTDAERETFNQLQVKNPLFERGSAKGGRGEELGEPARAINNIYQPYLYQNSGQNSRRKVGLSNRGIIASQEIQESEFRRHNKKLRTKKSKSRIKKGQKSKRDFEGKAGKVD